MTAIYLGLGSNVDREHFLRRGLDALEQLLGPLQCSPVFESDAVGVLGQRFFNMVVGAQTHLSLADLNAGLKAIEAACGRRESRTAGRITLDIDVLVYGELTGRHDGIELPRPELRRNAFVLWPLALLAPQLTLAGEPSNIAGVWSAWQGNQMLWPVEFAWREQSLTPLPLIETYRPRDVSGR
ncbi:2-amino-4-hydroxy-6-hydroxymethyldihydropteridinediphosphokinase [Halopseudomonas xinjiangensis]|uniref:2-amino-4-hydroxy-6-hydroxymethyldihydropteridine diphosphokinase n=1 Tax=Halopseudomonas xinjiangensis TaxID=487184 RepID=A0A1H1Z1Y7_9GAMM|nr:2-amino-4-hydroxy-6-hydroxymethyldihydropteridine diphosphokinase [Halopseudomonas xinjiangensis]SDT27633.1 2-amino-4-hydroxy-6-hydroxymethyldihydropteridinediphosphokinase [Halopseudomonas xinjiangensis]